MRSATLQDVGELKLLRQLCRRLPQRPDVRTGPGDDCAVVRPRSSGADDWLLTSDPVIEGVHFTAHAPARAIGHKALARALSDIAAMGGEPCWALVNLVAPPALPAARLSGVLRGLAALARRTGVAVAGGDLSAGPALAVHVLAVGRVARGRAVLRSGGRPGDMLFVTGRLGGSRAGKHLRFMPRLREGRWLGRHGWARAMIDLSDGLATDLRRLALASGTGAELWLPALPLAAAARRAGSAAAARRHALEDGEDFELLLAVAADRARALPAAWRRAFDLPCTGIGRLTDRRGVVVTVDARGRRGLLRAAGFRHFQ